MDSDTLICLVIFAGLVIFVIYKIKCHLDSLAKRNKEREEARTIIANIQRATDTQGITGNNANQAAEKALIKNCQFYKEEYTAGNVTHKAYCDLDKKPCLELHCQELGHPLPQYCDKYYKKEKYINYTTKCPFLGWREENVEYKTDIEEYNGPAKVEYCTLTGRKFYEEVADRWTHNTATLKDSKGNRIHMEKRYGYCTGCSECAYFQSTKLTPPNK